MFSRIMLITLPLSIGALGCWLPGCAPPDPDGDPQPNTNGDAEPDIGEDPFLNYTPDPDVYSKAPDETLMLELEDEDDGPLRFPANQLVVLFEADTPRSEAERLANELGGSIVGQVPSISLYQLELPTTTLDELDAAMAQAESDANVLAAAFNFELMFAQVCPAINDNEDELILADRCPFEDTEYYQAITMWDIFRPHLQLSPVRVAVIDSGLQVGNGEFAGIVSEGRLINLLGRDAPWGDPHPHGHGTGVIGLIAADDNGQVINGIASRFLERDLRVAVGPAQTFADAIVMAERAALSGAHVVNLSFTAPNNPRGQAVADSWPLVMDLHSDVLFVVSAGDRDRAITAQTPLAGVNLPNVITVGGTMSCWPTERSLISNYGPAVDIGAPGMAVPTVPKEGGPHVRFADGTSYAAPQVTSLAAILRSINPWLSPEANIELMTRETLPTTAELGTARLTFTFPIELLLLEMPGVGDPVRSWIDPRGRNAQAATGLLLSRICPAGVTFTVEGFGTFEASTATSDDHLVFGTLNSTTFSVAGYTEDERFSIVSGHGGYSLRLGEYLILPDPPPDAMNVIFAANDGDDHGGGLSGTVILDSCQIVERDPFTGVLPFIVNMSGSFEGAVEVLNMGSSEITVHAFEGYFSNVPLGTGLVSAEDPIVAEIEQTCEGGRLSDEPVEGEADGS